MEAMTKRRSHSAALRQVAEKFLAGETLHTLSKRHDISRQLIRIWVGKFDRPDLCRHPGWLRLSGGYSRCVVAQVVGYAISRSMYARIAVAALKVAIRNRVH